MTRAEDALEAATLGAAYVGVIFAPGPRCLTTARAASVLAAVGRNVRTAGVFSEPFTDTIAETARTLGLRVIHLHGEQDPDAIARLRDSFDGEIWGVIRVVDGRIPETAAELFGAADAVLLDAHVPGRLGGTGMTLPWSELRRSNPSVATRDCGRLLRCGDGTRDQGSRAHARIQGRRTCQHMT